MRRTGKTTRLIDKCIQILFTHNLLVLPSKENYIYGYYSVDDPTVVTPFNNWHNTEERDRIIKIIFTRLSSEHPGTTYSRVGGLIKIINK